MIICAFKSATKYTCKPLCAIASPPIKTFRKEPRARFTQIDIRSYIYNHLPHIYTLPYNGYRSRFLPTLLMATVRWLSESPPRTRPCCCNWASSLIHGSFECEAMYQNLHSKGLPIYPIPLLG